MNQSPRVFISYARSDGEPLYACAVAPDGMTVVAGGDLGRVHSLRLEGLERAKTEG
jgi:hypothetical protein